MRLEGQWRESDRLLTSGVPKHTFHCYSMRLHLAKRRLWKPRHRSQRRISSSCVVRGLRPCSSCDLNTPFFSMIRLASRRCFLPRGFCLPVVDFPAFSFRGLRGELLRSSRGNGEELVVGRTCHSRGLSIQFIHIPYGYLHPKSPMEFSPFFPITCALCSCSSCNSEASSLRSSPRVPRMLSSRIQSFCFALFVHAELRFS